MRRCFLLGLLVAAVSLVAGCGAGPGRLIPPSPTPDAAPEAAIQRYFAAQERGDATLAWSLMGPDWRAQYPPDQWRQLLSHPQPVHFLSAQETAASGAQPAAERAQRREYLVELDVQGSNPGAWNPGRNTRFVGVVHGPQGWLVDAIHSSPGFVACAVQGCGRPADRATARPG